MDGSDQFQLKPGQYRLTFSQCGEDQIVGFVLQAMGITNVTYVDIGTHHPVKGNNTFLFYMSGGHGICIEPNPDLCEDIQRVRNRDICLNVGIGGQSHEPVDYFMMSNSALNTFSETEASRIQSYGSHTLEKVLKIPIVSIATLLDEYFEEVPHFISIDGEGLDMEIVQAIPLDRFRPTVVCVETINYAEDNTETKRDDIISYFESHDYLNYADTYINTIFVDREAWQSRSSSRRQ